MACAPRAHSWACASLGELRHPRLQRLLAAWSADCFHPRLGVEVRGGEKGRSHQESGAPEIEDFVELLTLF